MTQERHDYALVVLRQEHQRLLQEVLLVGPGPLQLDLRQDYLKDLARAINLIVIDQKKQGG